MSKRDEFITVIQTLRAVLSTITDEQRIGLLRQATQQYGLSLEEADQILKDSELVIGESVNYFEVLEISVEDIQSFTEAAIAARVDAAHKNLYEASLNAGGRIRPDGRTEEQWRGILNEAKAALIDPQKRQAHIAELERETASDQVMSNANMGSSLGRSAPVGMVLIPAGEFDMGSDDPGTDDREQPVHKVYVDAFYMDATEVTNHQFKEFLLENPRWQKGHVKSQFAAEFGPDFYLHPWNGNNYPNGKADHPVTHISWYAAMAYSEWAGKRLPTEAEWEYAARGGLNGMKYPNGNTITPKDANYDSDIGDTTSVGRYPANGYGLYDMVGNVWEWCLDEYDADFYSTFPRNGVAHNPLSGSDSIAWILDNWMDVTSKRVLRSGSWDDSPSVVRVATRGGLAPAFTYFDYGGFRCARSLTP